MPIEINGNLCFNQNWYSETKTKKQIFQIKILKGINFFLIIICMLIQFSVYLFSLKIYMVH